MQEIRFHGRGGQGTVVASIVMAKAFFSAGFYVQTFPVFGVERRGAPVEAYIRLDEEKILVRSNVYTPDHVVVQDAKLLNTVDITNGLKPGGWILINAVDPSEYVKRFSGYRIATVDATGIAIQNGLGTKTYPMVNTAMIGAFAKLLELPPMELLSAAIEKEIKVKPKENIKAAQAAYDSVRVLN